MMNEKLTLAAEQQAPPEGFRSRHRALFSELRRTALVLLVFVVFYSVHIISALKDQHSSQVQPVDTRKVPLDIHNMAKCGNARTALTELVLPAITRVHDKVDFRLSIVGAPGENGTTECWHGPDECNGALIELCAQDTHDAWTTARFAECVTHEFERIPHRDLYEECAARTLVDMDAVDGCIAKDDGEYGRQLVHDSAQHTIDSHVRISGTVRLNGEIYCIRDKDHWASCPNGANVDDLVDEIERLYSAGH